MTYDDYDITSTNSDNRKFSATAEQYLTFEKPTNYASTVRDKSAFEVFKQRKVKGRRRKVWEEKSREYM